TAGSETNQNNTAATEATTTADNAATENTDTTVVTPIESNEEQLTEQELKEQTLRDTSTIFFAFDNSTIAGDYEDVLSAHAEYLVKNPAVKVTIEGHADERGTPEYNIALGERRAQAVQKYISALGVQADQISIVSFGEEKPLQLGQAEEAYAQNRRAVLVY
ncbi:peptidoglycan-associated lipoprotein Pal, partial [Vibrio sp.]|nr:peptidoglycan-associated lipoprotein Pal [Vibrio sp.]